MVLLRSSARARRGCREKPRVFPSTSAAFDNFCRALRKSFRERGGRSEVQGKLVAERILGLAGSVDALGAVR
jgi:hypothetical protein